MAKKAAAANDAKGKTQTVAVEILKPERPPAQNVSVKIVKPEQAVQTVVADVPSRRQISVSPELNARMARHAEENWSAVACRAFERRLDEITSQKEDESMEEVLDGLRAALREEESEMYQEGWNTGRDWVKRFKPAKELKRLARYRDSVDAGTWDTMLEIGSPGSNAPHLAREILSQEADDQELNEFWENAIGTDDWEEKMDDNPFIKGFAEGALEIWDQL